MGVNTKASREKYLNDVRTVNTNVVTDSTILASTRATVKLGAYGPYHAQNNQLGILIEAQRLVYNEAHPDT